MSQGFSILIKDGKTHVKSFFKENTYDSFFIETDDYDILVEGVILNLKALLENTTKSFPEFFKDFYHKKGILVLKQLEGEFRGFIRDKIKDEIFVFTNPTSSQRVFYATINSCIFIDSDLVRMSRTIKENDISIHPDIISLYQILAIGNLLEKRTPIENIYKIPDGNFLSINCKNQMLTLETYFDITSTEDFSHSRDKAVDRIHEVFTESVKMEYDKDSELKTSHLALLSGGLDSRMAMMYAIKNGFDIGAAFCFSQSNYLDEKISRKIALDYHVNYEFVPLDHGAFLKKIDELTRISEGCVHFTGGIHVSHAVDHLKYSNFSLFHGGQIGDGILGGFNSEPKRKKPSHYKIIVNADFLPQIQEDLDHVLLKYEREEVFLLKNLAYNRTVLGAQVLQQKAYMVSPFMTRDFLKLSVSLPEEWKYKHQLYQQWLLKHCREASQYTWERTLMKPDAQWKIQFGEKYMKGARNVLYGKLLNRPEKTSMYPYQYYFDADVSIQEYYLNYFNENIERLENYPDLQKDVRLLFDSPSFYHKAYAVNILSIFKLYF
nr:hypothetical protein [uncultured Chryseobacterium sp.]